MTVRYSKVDLTLVLTKALLRSAALLDLSESQLAAALGVSESSMMVRGTVTLKSGSKQAELATLLVRCFHALDALVDGNDAQRRKWNSAAFRVNMPSPDA